MKFLVPIKRVPAPEQRILVGADGHVDFSRLAFAINPFDAIALEESLRIRERGEGSVEVLAVTIGGAECEEQLRTALAMGADRALLVAAAPTTLDSWCVARLLAAVVRREKPNVVLMGKQAIDDDANQAGQFLAALLGWPQATFASLVDFDFAAQPARVRVARETDLGIETISAALPVVITVDLRLNEPRYASLPSIMKARKKPIEHTSCEELEVLIEPRVELIRLESASSQRAGVRVKDVPELVHRLRNEAKVI